MKILALNNIPMLKSLTQDQLATLSDEVEVHKNLKTSLIYDINTPHKYVYIVYKGVIKLGMIASCGKTLTKDIVYENELFGENVFGKQTSTSEFAEVMADATYFAIPVDHFKQLVMENARFASAILSSIVLKLQNLEIRLQNFVFKKAKERIVNFICRTGINKGIRIGVNECLINHGMSHKEIAYLTDTSRQTVARILSELKREDFIHYGCRKSGKILIRNFDAVLAS